MRRAAAALALLWTIVVGAFLVLGPVYGSSTSAARTGGNDGMSLEYTRGHGLLAAAPFALIHITVPVLLCLLPLLLRSVAAQTRPRRGGDGHRSPRPPWCAYDGLFYVPALIALVVALTHPPSARAPGLQHEAPARPSATD